MTLQWLVEVDWDNNGSFEADEGPRLQHLTVSRGRDNILRADGNGFQRAKVGEALLTLDNFDGRYDPLLSTSPLYPNVLPNREIRIRVTDGVTTWPVIRGKIDDVFPLSGGRQQARLVIKDGRQWLKGRSVRKALQTAIRTDTAIGHVLDEAAWPSAWGRSLGTGSDTLPYWWADGQLGAGGKTALDEIDDLVESELGQFWVAADGQATFLGRQALYNAAAAVNVTQAELLDSIFLPQPWNSVRNIVRVKVYPRVVSAAVELWRMQDKPLVLPGAALTVFAEFVASAAVVPGQNTVSPVATTDYTANTLANGTGTNLTANFTVTSFTTYGTSAKIVLTNTGATAGYVTLLKVRGDAVAAPNATVLERDVSSGSAYGQKLLNLDLPWQQSIAGAADFAYWLASLFDDPRSFPTIQIEAREDLQFGYDLFDRINLAVAAKGIDSDYYIGKIEHHWQFETGQGVVTTWRLEPADMTDYWKFTTQLNVSSRFAY